MIFLQLTQIGHSQKYDTPTDSWDYLQVGGSISSVPGTGYQIKRDNTDGPITFTGTLSTE